ncbi:MULTISPECIES: GH32 C-terminal domain-containing protein [unclassified Rhizobium]|uniref:GH32 C-terminal domain-containing protein n=1 Tax=unclassified Rhizobium TaxID=2613769 RepID=UPI001C832968|nr:MULTISPECIES: GH32 C-terminal domain-containing protein [unclassified Rhizobium]MBX5219754.1 glycoside hydrolase family 32 protein [Rhizobium sp. NLR8a]MBX5237830.1 glycoside hydrolase family 32 protein [Rhizobium sp. NLR22b]
MAKATVSFASGERLEFWAVGPGAVTISQYGETLWSVPAFEAHPSYYSYHHREAGSVVVEWDRPEAFLWAYSYDPATVAEAGIKLWEFSTDEILIRAGKEIGTWLRSDPQRPRIHFSPCRNWMNDPVGLCRMGDCWHLFYQFHPCGGDWGPMHWGHATSPDLFNWTHMPVFLHPEQNLWRLGATGGAFSGNAFEDRDGRLMFFYTERLPAYDLFKGYREIQKIARPDRRMIKAASISTVLEQRPEGVEHDFRDPKVWWDEAAGAYRMVLGASIHGDPAVLLYGSEDLREWKYLGPLFRAPPFFREQGARAVECPDFFPIDGKWVLIMGLVGHCDPGSGRHNLLYGLVGDFVDDRFIPDSDALQLLDFGSDYYAMQSFATDGRQIAFAWLFNWEFRKPAGSPYSGELSLPRQLSLDARNRICMRPADEVEEALTHAPLSSAEPGRYVLDDASIDIRLNGTLDGTRITATEAGQLSFSIVVEDQSISVQLPQDDGSIRYAAAIAGATDLRVIHDKGIVEIFADGGAVCGTRRNYLNVRPDDLVILSKAHVSVFSGG